MLIAALSEGPERIAEIVLGHGPVEGHAVSGVFLEGVPIGGDGVLEGLLIAALSEGRERIAEIVLGGGPIERHAVSGPLLEGFAVGGDRAVETLPFGIQNTPLIGGICFMVFQPRPVFCIERPNEPGGAGEVIGGLDVAAFGHCEVAATAFILCSAAKALLARLLVAPHGFGEMLVGAVDITSVNGLAGKGDDRSDFDLVIGEPGEVFFELYEACCALYQLLPPKFGGNLLIKKT